ncbi:MAG: hypothetical protein QM771_20200 [Nitrospira sp.]
MEQDLTESPAPELEAPVEELSPEDYVMGLVKSAQKAAGRLSTLSSAVKNQALEAMAEGLEAHEAELLAENEKDLEQFEATPERKALGDRLRLTFGAYSGHGRRDSRCRPPAGSAGRDAQNVDAAERHADRPDAGPHRGHRHHL